MIQSMPWLKPFKLMDTKISPSRHPYHHHRRSNCNREKFELEPVPTSTSEAFSCNTASLLATPLRVFLLKFKLTSMLQEPPRLCNIHLTSTAHHKDIEGPEKKQCPKPQSHATLKKEILELQEELNDQFSVRCALEEALSRRPFHFEIASRKSIPEPAKQLLSQIEVLELEVAYLEKNLLNLYRKTVTKQVSPSSTTRDGKGYKLTSGNQDISQQVPELVDIITDRENWAAQSSALSPLRYPSGSLKNMPHDMCATDELIDCGIRRTHSSLSQRSACSVRRASPYLSLANAVDSYHSLPLSMLEKCRMHTNTSGGISLAEHIGSNICHRVPRNPNHLSEEMIKCISAIFCELAHPPLMIHDFLPSPISCSSSLEIISSQDRVDIWSSQCGKFSSSNSRYGNPFSAGKSAQFSGPHCSVVKIQGLCNKLADVEEKLQYYRSLVYQLEKLDARKLNHEEKLAFWINVHNALVMHAFLVSGISKSSQRRLSLLVKAAYKVGGQIITANMIQSSILRCRISRPGQWQKILFNWKNRFRAGDAIKAYMIEHLEPRLYFALCSGSRSDPMVRVYTAKKVCEELEGAKEEYIQSRFSVNREQKIELPKLVEVFAKDSDVREACLVEMVEQHMPECLKRSSWQRKRIRWIPHNFSFQYMLSKELLTWKRG